MKKRPLYLIAWRVHVILTKKNNSSDVRKQEKDVVAMAREGENDRSRERESACVCVLLICGYDV
jgi:hypothetical protein